MHTNPAPEEEEVSQSETFTPQETAMLKSASQGLRGFGNPGTIFCVYVSDNIFHYFCPGSDNVSVLLEYDDAESDDSDSNASRTGRRKKQTVRAPPPLPGFGNPAFEDDSAQTGTYI